MLRQQLHHSIFLLYFPRHYQQLRLAEAFQFCLRPFVPQRG